MQVLGAAYPAFATENLDSASPNNSIKQTGGTGSLCRRTGDDG